MSAFGEEFKPPQHTRSFSDGHRLDDITRLKRLFSIDSQDDSARQRRNSLDCPSSLDPFDPKALIRLTSDSTTSTDLWFSPLVKQSSIEVPLSPISETFDTYVDAVMRAESTNSIAWRAAAFRRKSCLKPHARIARADSEQALFFYQAGLGLLLAINFLKTARCLNTQNDACARLLQNDPTIMLTANWDLFNPENWQHIWQNLQDHKFRANAINVLRLISLYHLQQLLATAFSDLLERKQGTALQLIAMLLIYSDLVLQAWIFAQLHNRDLSSPRQLTWNWRVFCQRQDTEEDCSDDSSSEPEDRTSPAITPGLTPPRTPERMANR